ncbi:MAG: hypothetical protein KIT73_04645 [Burkholderiales bacterium]|nr:hypothetical protein [Burkholderiales bacterium]
MGGDRSRNDEVLREIVPTIERHRAPRGPRPLARLRRNRRQILIEHVEREYQQCRPIFLDRATEGRSLGGEFEQRSHQRGQ